MIEMPIFPDEQWYLMQVKKLFIKGKVQEKDINKKFLQSQEVNDINKQLNEILDIRDFDETLDGDNFLEKIIIAPYQTLSHIYQKIIINHSTLFREKVIVNGKETFRVKTEWMPLVNAYHRLVRNKINIEIVERYKIKKEKYFREIKEIGEPIVRDKLLQMYRNKFQNEMMENKDQEIIRLINNAYGGSDKVDIEDLKNKLS